jgi:hypothetical protein
MNSALNAFLMLCLVTPSVSFAGDGKPPWAWTAAERSKARLDPAKRAARQAEHRARAMARGGVNAPEASSTGEVIDGEVNPELFYPTELFESLVYSAFVSLPRIYPRVVRERSSDLFRDAREWERFADIVAPFAAALAEERYLLDVQSKGDPSTTPRAIQRLVVLRQEKCALLGNAISGARASFGRERFDRMLYETVPPGSSASFSPGGLELSDAVELQREETCR